MSDFILQAKIREKKDSVRLLRKKYTIPGIVYGHGLENKLVSVPFSEFKKIYKSAGESTLLDLVIAEDKPVKVLIHDISRNVETHDVEHVDFYQVNMKEKIHAEIPVTFKGVSPAVKEMSGVLITQIETIPVRCFPGDLINEFVVDLTTLTDFTKRITVGDLIIPDTIEVQKDLSNTIVLVSAPRVLTAEELAEDQVVVDAKEDSAGKATEEGGKEAPGSAPSANDSKEKAK